MHSTTTITALALAKNGSYILAFAASLEWLGFSPTSLSLFGILMIIDVFTGVTRSMMLGTGSSFKSETLKKGIIPKIMLMFLILSFGMTAKIVGFDTGVYLQGVVSVLALGELYSIIGNIHSARTGKPKDEFDAVKFLLSRVADLITKYAK